MDDVHDDTHTQPNSTNNSPPNSQTDHSTASLTEPRLSRKREREASQEPGTPRDTEERQDVRDRRTPAKKNRLQTTEEDSERSRSPPQSHTPPPQPDHHHNRNHPAAASPPEARKLKQIRQRVQDLSWVDTSGSPSAAGCAGAPSTGSDEADGPEVIMSPVIGQHEVIKGSDESGKKVPRTPSPPASIASSQGAPPSDETHIRDVPEIDRHGPTAIQPDSPARPTTITATSSNGSNQDTPPIEIEEDKEEEKSLKRKLIARAPSSTHLVGAQAVKRAREEDKEIDGESSKDASIAEQKEPDVVQPEEKKRKQVGFLAFAAKTSPFANVKPDATSPFGSGPKPSTLFGPPGSKANTPPPTFLAPSPAAASAFSPFSPNTPSQQASSTTYTKPIPKFGSPSPFASFASTSKKATTFASPSPFAFASASTSTTFATASSSASSGSPPPSSGGSGAGPVRRAKSPRPGAFGSYSSSVARFGAASPPRRVKAPNKGSDASQSASEDEPPKATATFGEILQATGAGSESEAEDDKNKYSEMDVVHTGEEDDLTVHQVRCKLFIVDGDQGYKERGVGQLKLNIHRSDASHPRLLMRADGVHRLILNARLLPGMTATIAQDPKYLLILVHVDGKFVPHMIRLKDAKMALQLQEQILAHVPPTVSPTDAKEIDAGGGGGGKETV